MILVTGATGNVGGEVVRRLVEGGHAVRSLTRDPAKAAKMGLPGEFVRGDLHAPETFEAAMAGVDKAFLLADAMELSAITRDFVAAARRAGVRHVVLNSSGTILMEPATAIGNWHLAAERELQSSGLEWTMVRPGNFNSNALRWASTIRSQGAVYAPAGGSSAPIDPRDIGAVAATALSTPNHEGKTYVLTGPEVMTAKEQVDQIGAAIGKPLRFIEVPEAGARAGMLKAGLPEVLADAVLELMRADPNGSWAQATSTVRDVTGKEARTFAAWARDNAAEFM